MTIFMRMFLWMVVGLLALTGVLLILSNNVGLLVTVANIIHPGILHAERLEGSLLHHLRFDTLEYEDNSVQIRLTQGDLQWNLRDWPSIDHIRAQIHLDSITILSKPTLSSQSAPTKPQSAATFHIPFPRISVDSLQIHHIQIDNYSVDNLHLQGFYSQEKWSISKLKASLINLNKIHPSLAGLQANMTLNGNVQAHHGAVSGTLAVPEAKLKLATFTKTVRLTSDVMIVPDVSVAQTMSATTPIHMQIKVGPNVFIDAQGLQGYIEGTLQVNQTREHPVSAIGELAIRQGAYKAYNQNLSIEQGKLIFSGGPITNPVMSLRAVRNFNDNDNWKSSERLFDFSTTNLQSMTFSQHLKVGIDVSGHLNAPKISLFSIPAGLSQADILSMLLIGKPASHAIGASSDLLITAMAAMNLDSGPKGAQLLSQLKEALGVDIELKRDTSPQATTNPDTRTGVVLSKALSKRLYISYDMGLFTEDSNVVSLKYLLNKYFTLQVSGSDSGNGIDLLYTN